MRLPLLFLLAVAACVAVSEAKPRRRPKPPIKGDDYSRPGRRRHRKVLSQHTRPYDKAISIDSGVESFTLLHSRARASNRGVVEYGRARRPRARHTTWYGWAGTGVV
ncbi:hypothetical protein FJT64_010272 [Amphibalanus amphitrite]|uniref:Secreted protein n=1 Tax=Amphibalanus amphitrite TaxID=1232801 RepID=A0A6A4VN00_AMPAM|nr:hypothetical protein FJT64_010272 [Amphibalanus amphitrite]